MNGSTPASGFARPRLVMSRCLEVEACRYDGRMIRSAVVRRLEPWVDVLPVCPEVEVGLGVPRDPIRLVRVSGSTRLVQPSTGRDLTDAMRAFSDRFLDGVGDVDGFLLKSRSPSCAVDRVKVYDAPGSGSSVDREHGLFAAAVLRRFPDWPVEHEGRLTDPRVRDHFLTRIFALAGLRAVGRSGRMADLVAFQARHKLTLMAHAPALQRELGRMVAEPGARSFQEVHAEYGALFRQALARPPGPGRHVNVIQHAQGYFRERLSGPETHRFLALQEEYRAGCIGRARLLVVLEGWIARFGERYLEGQTYFRPYPPELAEPPGGGGEGIG